MTTLSQLDQLKKYTTVVADTGDLNSMKKFSPQDATTNPSLILKATQMPDYKYLVDKTIQDTKSKNLSPTEQLHYAVDYLLVLFGCEILKIVPGRVSTEVDAHLSFDVEGSLKRAHKIIQLYKDQNIDPSRILIKLASTWEGSLAAKTLQKEGINCNMTLMFSLPQAIICAEAGAKLISPFVGRIYDWYKKETNKDYQGDNDPGVQSVKQIYNYYKKFDYPTQVMGASFRNKGQILSLAGCDLLTISPELLEELKSSTEPVPQKLSPTIAKNENINKIQLDEKTFRYQFNDNPMAVDKLAEGIRKFAADTITLEKLIAEKLKA